MNHKLYRSNNSLWFDIKLIGITAIQIDLTHLPQDKMAAMLADDIFKCIFLNENVSISIQISLKFAPKGSIDNKLALVQVMAWRQTGDKPLPEAMLTQFTDTNVALWGDELNEGIILFIYWYTAVLAPIKPPTAFQDVINYVP